MSGKIELLIRKGKAKRGDLKYYPYWSWKITGEDDVTTIISPTWIQLKQAIRETILHELQTEINDHVLEEVYTNALK